jgi:hypothetical protein
MGPEGSVSCSLKPPSLLDFIPSPLNHVHTFPRHVPSHVRLHVAPSCSQPAMTVAHPDSAGQFLSVTAQTVCTDSRFDKRCSLPSSARLVSVCVYIHVCSLRPCSISCSLFTPTYTHWTHYILCHFDYCLHIKGDIIFVSLVQRSPTKCLAKLRNLLCETAKVLTRTVEPLMMMMMMIFV